MFKSIIAAASALAASVAALPHAANSAVAARQEEPLAYWPASNFQEGCSPGGCIAGFNLTALAGYVSGAPAFNVFCHPIYIQQGWIDCDPVGEQAAGSSVQSMWTDASERELIKLSVAHLWREGEASYNASGSVEIEATETSFEVPVLGVVGIL